MDMPAAPPKTAAQLACGRFLRDDLARRSKRKDERREVIAEIERERAVQAALAQTAARLPWAKRYAYHRVAAPTRGDA